MSLVLTVLSVVETRTPCCQRKVRLPASMHATNVCQRTCSKCHAVYRVIVRPGKQSKLGVLTRVEWVRQ